MYSVSNPVNSQSSTAMRLFLAALLIFSFILVAGVSTASAYYQAFTGKKGINYHQFTVPQDSLVYWSLIADSDGTSNTIEFQWPFDQCRSGCGDYCGWFTIYKKQDVPNRYSGAPKLPIGPGKVDIIVVTDSSKYTLFVTQVQTKIYNTDKEPNLPFHKDLVHDLGTVYNRKSIASHTNFYGCWDRTTYGNRNQEDSADYWKFKVANPGTYKMVVWDLEVAPHYGGTDQLTCYPYLGLIETDGNYRKNLFEQLNLKNISETPEFTLDPSKTYYLDFQLVGRHFIWSQYASFELDLRRTDFPQPYLQIRKDIFPNGTPDSTVCGEKESYTALISNRGDATAFAHVKLELYNTNLPQKKFTYRKDINIPTDGKWYIIKFKVAIPKTRETASGDWTIKWSAYDSDFRDSYVQMVDSMEVLCRPLPLAALHLLLMGGFE